jgi:hypothetical protein
MWKIHCLMYMCFLLLLAPQLRYSDLCKESQQILRKGNWQALPSRDSTGRIILVHQGWISLPTARLRVSGSDVSGRYSEILLTKAISSLNTTDQDNSVYDECGV